MSMALKGVSYNAGRRLSAFQRKHCYCKPAFNAKDGVICRGYVRDTASQYALKLWQEIDGDEKLSSIASSLETVKEALPNVQSEGDKILREVLNTELGSFLRQVQDIDFTALKFDVPEVPVEISQLTTSFNGLLENLDLSLLPAQGSLALLFLLGYRFLGTSATNMDELPLRYDPQAAAQYFSKRRGLVLKRVYEILSGSASFLLSLKLENEKSEELTPKLRQKQAEQLRNLLSKLGPTFVKAGQALSIRVDLLPEVYLEELRTLQDRVPPFPTEEALKILDKEFESKGGVKGVFEYLSEEPIASASLGQVYKGKLKGSEEEVAVKVQRPDILSSIALDLHILRIIAPIFEKSKNLNSDLASLVDEWGSRFVAELDYIREAENGQQFIDAMKARNITSVTSAVPNMELSTSRVLVTSWINGERLELSKEEDVAKLCGIALTAYLTMLLDTGTLHADPHPGNLLRTDEGQLCILDWGLTTEITQNRQYAIIDYIAHLVAEDYTRIPRDLINLGFIPPGKENAIDDQGVVRALSVVFRNLASGGGAKGINVSDVATEVQYIQKKYGNIFQIPAYFAYILRSFSVLEGIGLQNDPKYKIVQECYPYIARRLFSDNSPRVRAALKAIMYESTAESGQAKLNVKRFAKLANAFRTYTDQSVSLLPKDSEQQETEGPSIADATIVKETIGLLFSVEGNYLQELLVREAARTVDTLGRESVRQGIELASTLLTGRRGGAAIPIPSNMLPPELQKQVDFLFAPLTAKAEDDEIVLDTVRSIWEIVEPELSRMRSTSSSDLRSMARNSSSMTKFLPGLDEVGPGVAATVLRFNAALFERVSTRIGLVDNASNSKRRT